jgi:hypothetical protein
MRSKCRGIAPLLLLLLASIAAAALVTGCGGRTPELVIDPGDAAGLDGGNFEDVAVACAPTPCPSDAPWDPALCACVYGPGPDAEPSPPGPTMCPQICDPPSVVEMIGQTCACVFVPDDASPGYDAPYVDDVWIYPTYDSSLPVYDSQPVYPDVGCPYFYYCGAGYYLSTGCQCLQCPADSCAPGQTPGTNCSSCTQCTTKCPAGFHYGQGCGCAPDGVDAGPVTSRDAGTNCTIGGYQTIPAGSWYAMGTCQDNVTQYGCYCNTDGTATCSLTCPAPAPCNIPGEGTCPYGSQCVYGTCSSSSSSLLVCSCYNSGSASCYTYKCGDSGYPFAMDAGNTNDGGATCLLEGYYSCNAGSFCGLGTCPDGTQYGCTCHADGTADCNLNCPPPAPCDIPGQGSCPYGSQCTFGCGSGQTSGLSCYCYGSGASCNTISCSMYPGLGDSGYAHD